MINFSVELLMRNAKVQGHSIIPDITSDFNNFDTKLILKNFAKIPIQTHSLNVGLVRDRCELFEDTDALITFEKGLPIGVFTADCVPIILYASDVEGVAAVHAGWKGTLGGIIDNTLNILEEYGAKAENLMVAFGPSISKKQYEVDEKLAEKFILAGFADFISYPSGEDGKPHIDLQGVNMERLLRRGVKMENVILHPGCTYNSKSEEGKPLYHSHRRSGGSPARMLTSIILLK